MFALLKSFPSSTIKLNCIHSIPSINRPDQQISVDITNLAYKMFGGCITQHRPPLRILSFCHLVRPTEARHLLNSSGNGKEQSFFELCFESDPVKVEEHIQHIYLGLL